MGEVELLRKAREAGLTVEVDGDKLRIRGPKQWEPLALAILDRKTEVFPIVAAMSEYATRKPRDTGPRTTTLTSDRQAGALGSATTRDNSGPHRWARRAAGLLSTVGDAGIRAELRELFEHRTAVVGINRRLGLNEAERIAFGELQTAMRQWTKHHVRRL